jgi:hypothetical protein
MNLRHEFQPERRLNLDRIDRAVIRGGKLIGRCPACAAEGGDRTGNHLIVYEEGRGKFGCIAHAGDHDHRCRIAELLGFDSVPLPIRLPVVRVVKKPAAGIKIPPLRYPTIGELQQLAQVRRLPFIAGLELAARAGHLRIAEKFDAGKLVVAWVLSDSSRRNAQARRLDGELWAGIGAKAWTLAGSQAAWPIGIADVGDKPHVVLCEGGPDLLAAWTCAWRDGHIARVAPCCMVGAGLRIHEDAISAFRGKGVFLVPHRDEAGASAKETWIAQLRAAGVKWIRVMSVRPYKDLNEALTASPADPMEDFEA